MQQFPVGAFVSQGSLLGPNLWNIFWDGYLQLHPHLSVYADDYKLTISHNRQHHLQTARQLYTKLDTINEWGNPAASELCPR